MTKHTEEDFEGAAREIASQSGHRGEVTNYQIAKHLDRSPGGGLYKQLREWRIGSRIANSILSRSECVGGALVDRGDEHNAPIAGAIARDIAPQELDDLRELYVEVMAERDDAQNEVARLTQLLSEMRARERDLKHELSVLRFCRADRSAQMRLAAASLSAGLAVSRPQRNVR